jgi:hypothetical protein
MENNTITRPLTGQKNELKRPARLHQPMGENLTFKIIQRSLLYFSQALFFDSWGRNQPTAVNASHDYAKSLKNHSLPSRMPWDH